MTIIVWLATFIAAFVGVLVKIALQPSPASDYLRHVLLVAFVAALIAMVVIGGAWDLYSALRGLAS